MFQPHRVIIPQDKQSRSSRRQASAVFVHPDADTLISCLDGGDKYPDILAGKHTRNRIEDTLHTKYET